MSRFFIVVTCFLLSVTVVYAENNLCKIHQCITVIDAGSTGSRAHLYAYDLDETNTPFNINEIWAKKVQPGFASIEPDSKTINAYITALLADAPDHQAPVYFYATAGMRLLPSSKQKLYYKELQQWFTQHDQWHLVQAKTITGNEEGLYDWLALNYHLGTLKSVDTKSVGVMDMGGASVQIAFPIQKNENLGSEYQIEVEIYGQHYNLFVHSFLGLGQTEMSRHFLNSSSCFANNYPLPDGQTGQGNMYSCEQEISSLMNTLFEVNNTIQPVLAGNPVDSWYALGGLTNLADNKLFHFANDQLTNNDLMQQADSQICHQQWDILSSQFPNDDYVYKYCLLSAYYYALMVDGYGIYPEQTVHYIPPKQELDWTKGVVLYH